MTEVNSHKKLILEYLKAGNSLTALEAWRLWNILTSLRSRISDIRKDGFNIQTEMVSNNGKTFAKYKLIPETKQGELF